MIIRNKVRTILGTCILILSFIILFGMDVYGRETEVQVEAVQASEQDMSQCEFYDSMSEEDFRQSETEKPDDGICLFTLKETIEDTGYFRSNLEEEALEIYDWIESAELNYQNNAAKVSFYLNEDELPAEVFELYRSVFAVAMWSYEYDHLEKFYWNDLNVIDISANTFYGNDGVKFTMTFSYRVSPFYTPELEMEANQKLAEGIQGAEGLEDTEKQLLYLNTWICDNCTYDYEGLYADDYTEEAYYAHSMMGLLVKGTGVCETYAKTMKLLCQNLDIPCTVVVSDTHAFNYVRLNGVWYMIDCTWNDKEDNPEAYQDYFLMPNREPLDYHHIESDIYTYPITSSDAYYKKSQELIITDKSGDEILSLKLDAGKTSTLYVYGNQNTIEFTSADPAIATVTSAGTIKGMKPGKVQILISAGGDAYYETAEETIQVTVRPGATTKVTLENTSTGVKVSWAKVPDATGYYVYRGSSKIAKITSGKTLSYTDTSKLTNGSKYTYKVYAYADTGTSILYKSAKIYRLSRPKISSLKNTSSKKMTVTYNKNSKATGYKVKYSTSSSFSTSKTVAVTSYKKVSKVIGSLKKGKTYYVKVRSYRKVDGVTWHSAWSDKKKVKIKK